MFNVTFLEWLKGTKSINFNQVLGFILREEHIIYLLFTFTVYVCIIYYVIHIIEVYLFNKHHYFFILFLIKYVLCV